MVSVVPSTLSWPNAMFNANLTSDKLLKTTTKLKKIDVAHASKITLLTSIQTTLIHYLSALKTDHQSRIIKELVVHLLKATVALTMLRVNSETRKNLVVRQMLIKTKTLLQKLKMTVTGQTTIKKM